MRLDKFLKISRLVKRRTIANTLCQAGKVFCNQKLAKAAYDVKVGDELMITIVGKTIVVVVIHIPEKINPSIDPLSLYTPVSKTYNDNIGIKPLASEPD